MFSVAFLIVLVTANQVFFILFPCYTYSILFSFEGNFQTEKPGSAISRGFLTTRAHQRQDTHTTESFVFILTSTNLLKRCQKYNLAFLRRRDLRVYLIVYFTADKLELSFLLLSPAFTIFRNVYTVCIKFYNQNCNVLSSFQGSICL